MRTISSSSKKEGFVLGNNKYDDDDDDDDDDVAVDFSNAVLYVGALQTITATVFTSAVSIVSCVAFPSSFVSAIRTLVLSSIVGIAIVRKPFKLGRVHGLNLIFRALQPCVLIYIGSEVAEQLVHTCTRESSTPSYRRFVFHSMSVLMVISGFLRARRPLAQTDFPFLLTAFALLVISMLPPPAVMLSGPLCSPPTLSYAAERVVRSFVFALLYSVFVYAAAPPVQSSSEMLICVMRASAASIWVLAAHFVLLPFAVIQCGFVIYTRIFGDEYVLEDENTPLMTPIVDHNKSSEFDLNDGGNEKETNVTSTESGNASESFLKNGLNYTDAEMIVPPFQTIGARGLVDIGASNGCIKTTNPRARVGGFNDMDMAAIAARLEAEEPLKVHNAACAV